MSKKLIIFDFDGVIANSFNLAFRTAKQATPHLTEEEYRARWEENINANQELNRIPAGFNFHAIYSASLPKQKVFDGIPEVIEELTKTYPLTIVSSSMTESIKNFLIHHRLDHFFQDILGYDISPNKTVKIKSLLEKHQVAPIDALMITDTPGDIKEAKAANVQSVAVTWGFTNETTLRKDSPVALINRPAELMTSIQDFFS